MELIHGFSRDNLKGDFYGGVTAAIVALPLAMAFGVASGAGPIAGIYGAIFVGFFAAIFGGTPSQVSGPTGPMTVVMAGILTRFVAIDPVAGPAMAFTVVLMGGALQIVFGAFKLGRYIRLVPFPVISGFMTGIGVIIILLQIGPLIGHPSASGPLIAIKHLPEQLVSINYGALSLGILTLAIVYLLPSRINKLIPAPLMALIAGTLALMYAYPSGTATVLGDIPTGFPIPHAPTVFLAHLPAMIKSALILALLGSIDSLLTSLVADSVTRTQHDSDRELIGQGIGNMVAGIFGGLPGAGATMRTVVNIRAGGRTPISGSMHALILLGVVLGLGKFAAHIPHVVLAGILIKVGTDIIDWDYLKRSRTAPRAGVLLMLAVLFTTVFVDLITSVAVGMIAASLLLVHRMAEQQLSSIKVITGPMMAEEPPLCEEAMAILKAAKGQMLVYKLSGPLSFGAAKDMARRLARVGGYQALVLDLSEVISIDSTSGMAIEDMIRMAQETGRHVFLAGAKGKVREILEKLGVLKLMRSGYDHAERLTAIRHAGDVLGVVVTKDGK